MTTIQNGTHNGRNHKYCAALALLANAQREALAVVGWTDAEESEARLLAWTGGAARLLRLSPEGAGRSAEMRSFLKACGWLRTLNGAPVVWRSMDRKIYNISPETPLSPGEPMSVIRLTCAGIRSGMCEIEAARNCGLSDREAEVIGRVARGDGDREIARDLNISFHTVRAHVRNSYSKLKVSGRLEAVNKLRLQAN